MIAMGCLFLKLALRWKGGWHCLKVHQAKSLGKKKKIRISIKPYFFWLEGCYGTINNNNYFVLSCQNVLCKYITLSYVWTTKAMLSASTKALWNGINTRQNHFLMGSDTAKFCLCQNMSCLQFQLLRTCFPAVLMMFLVRKHISLGEKI